ncbi:MAG: glycosyltransferase family 4 protein, partial [Bacillota bacterium]|nr:glycosyltransferase family 4 protein [Bacillota bacterium]
WEGEGDGFFGLPVPNLPGPPQRRARRRLLDLLEKERPAILHVHGWMALSLALAAGAQRRTSLIFTAHTLLPQGNLLRRLGVRQVLRHGRNDVSLFLAVSQAVGRELEEGGVPGVKVKVLPPGVKIPAAGGEPIGQLEKGTFILGAASRFSPEKGLDVLLCAAAQLPRDRPWHLLLAGSGPEEGKLRRQIRQEGLEERVSFLGFLSSLAPFYDAIELLAVPSRQEGLGLAALEAMALGKPVVASRTGGLAEIIRDGETGFLVPPGDCSAWAAQLREILSLPLPRLQAMGAQARAAAQGLPWPAVVDAVEESYRQVLGRVR